MAAGPQLPLTTSSHACPHLLQVCVCVLSPTPTPSACPKLLSASFSAQEISFWLALRSAHQCPQQRLLLVTILPGIPVPSLCCMILEYLPCHYVDCLLTRTELR